MYESFILPTFSLNSINTKDQLRIELCYTHDWLKPVPMMCSAAGAQAVLKYTLKNVPGSPLPPGKKLLPYIRLTKNYEGTWHRAMRKVKIVNMLRRMGQERMRRNREREYSSEVFSVDVSAELCPLKAIGEVALLKFVTVYIFCK